MKNRSATSASPSSKGTDHKAMSISSVVIADEPSTDRHDSLAMPLPSPWLDALLVTLCNLPLASGEVGVVQAIIDSIGNIFPSMAVGATLVREGETRVLRALAVTGEHPARGTSSDRSQRMFPRFTFERAFELIDAGPGITLHLASDDGSIENDMTPIPLFVYRSGRVIRMALERVQEHERTIGLSQELYAQREQLIFAEKLATIGQMAAGLVHELNNPLTAIVAYTDYLLKRSAQRGGDPDESERLRRIAESAHRMRRFTRDLVSYARPSSDAPQPVIVSSIVDQALLFCDHLLEENGVEVTREFGDGVLPVRGIPEQLAQVFVNLLTNACHAVPNHDGKITVFTSVDDAESQVRIIVEDNGHGVAPENLPRLFLPFFTTKSEGNGTGLGLAIVKNIIEAHDGTITVESNTSGTRFIVSLPVAGARESGPHAKSEAPTR